MTADPATPRGGIRLSGGAPIPPAPGWGVHRPVTVSDHGIGAHIRIGAVVEIAYGHHVPACSWDDCLTALPARLSYLQGKRALRDHWGAEHAGGAA